jgi:hypothetical protein
MSEQDETPDKLIGSIPYGSVRPANRIRAQDSIPYGSLQPNAPAPVARTPQAQQPVNQALPMPPSSPPDQKK